MIDSLVGLMSGAIVALYLVAALYFLKFWRTGRDPLFLFFACALGLLALQRALLALGESLQEDQTQLYVLRLLAYLLLMVGIVIKNYPKRDGAQRKQ